MNMFARFDENSAMSLQDIKETKRYGRTHALTDGQRENSIPTTNKVCGGIIKIISFFLKITVISLTTSTTSIQAICLEFNIAC